MKYIITENQLKVLLKEDRVEFLKTQNVIAPEEIEKYQKNMSKRMDISDIPTGDIEPDEVKGKGKEIKITAIQSMDGIDIGYIIEKSGKKQIKLTDSTFQLFVDADPSRNKQYVQWIIDIFKKYTLHDIEEAKRFVTEDLSQATEALKQFDCVKESKKFRLNAKDRQGAPGNPKDIKQYESIGQLYGVVSGFICGEEEEEGGDESTGGLSKKGYKLFNDLMTYTKLGKARLHKLSNNVLIYQPLTLQSSCEPLGSLSNWCTRATPIGGIEKETGSEYFHQYRGDVSSHEYNKRPTGESSDYYVIMPIELFQAENPSQINDFPWQFHFETDQLRDKGNSQLPNNKIVSFMDKHPEVGEYFRKELGHWSQESIRQGDGLVDNKYVKWLNLFGGKLQDYINDEIYREGVEGVKRLAASQNVPLASNKYLKWLLSNEPGTELVDFIDDNIEKIDFSGINMNDLPDLSRFTKVKNITAENCGLKVMPSASKLPKAEGLTVMSLKNNDIKEANFSGWAEKFPKIFALNINENPINKIDFDGLTKLSNPPNELMVFRISLDNLSPEELKKYETWSEDGKLGKIF